MSSVLPLRGDPNGLEAAQVASRHASRSQAVHRPDIDGLRGIAVLSVLAVHAFPQLLKGGFIGVDIFFVLSGFLITGILLRTMEAGTFSFADFYARRARRIFPALCLVLLSCLVFGALSIFPYEARSLGKHIASGAVFISNFTLWREAGYFDVGAEAKPLLHLWSLGIEEQFYLVWPVAMLVLVRWPRHAVALVAAMLLASFACNLYFVVDKPSATFFHPLTRFWELMVGALLAQLTRRPDSGPVAWVQRRLSARPAWREAVPEAFALTGAGLLAGALWTIEKTDHFPGWWALLPTAGTFALLAAGPQAAVNRILLSHPILRFYGVVSYPLYLWHWPLLSFPVLMGIPLDNEVRVAILIASVVLAALTYELVEKPIRFGAAGGRRSALWLSGALALVGLGGYGMMKTDGLLNTYPESVRGIAAAQMRFEYAEYRVDHCMTRLHQGPEIFSDECTERGDTSRRLVFLWGDSHAASLYPGLAKIVHEQEKGYRLAQYTAAACPPLLSTPAASPPTCIPSKEYILRRIEAEVPDTVVLGGHWKLYGTDAATLSANMNSLRDTVAHLRALGVRRVVVFGHIPTWNIAQPSVLLQQWQRDRSVPERSRNQLDQRSLDVDKVVEKATAGTGAVYVSPITRMCDSNGCQVSTLRDGTYRAITNDDGHLTVDGSEILTERSREAIFH